ncbi:MAG: CSLREA domain-containing protein, partial [Chloroflexota bacterium]
MTRRFRFPDRPLPVLTVLLVLIVSIFTAILPQPVYAATFTVSKTADTNDGACDADCSLREAIAAANALGGADGISFDSGVFNPGTITLGSALPNITDDLTITGLVIIDGANNSELFFIASGVTVSMSGMTITHGDPAIHNQGTLTVTSSTLSDNTGFGAAIYNEGGTVTVNSSTFSGNSGTSGGAIYNYRGSLMVNSSTFSDNQADYGAAIVNYYGTAKVANSTFSGNSNITANTGQGGGIYNEGRSLTVANSTFSGNSSGAGGGIYNVTGMVTVNSSTFSGNSTSGFGGGGISNYVGTLIVTNSTFSGNSALTVTLGGGGILNLNDSSQPLPSQATISNSTFSGNSAVNGGGILTSSSSTTTLNNSIIANSLSGGDCIRSASTVNAHNSLILDGLTCINGANDNNLTGSDPLLDTLTGSPAYFPLKSGSPAIDTGDDNLLSEATVGVDFNGDGDTSDTLTTDEPGNSRIIGSTVDIGAFEASLSTALVSATKTVSGTFEEGQTVTYTVTLTNSGTGDQANNAGDEFSDTLPDQLTVVSATPSSGTALSAGNSVTWNGALAANGGSVTITITATINAGTAGDSVSNQGTAHYDSDGDNINDADGVTDDPGTGAVLDATAFTVVAPDVSVSKTATDVNGGVLVSGDTLRYTITISNNGTADAQNVSLTDATPANTTYVPGTTTLNASPVTDLPTDIMPFTAGGSIGTVTAGGSATVVFDVTIDTPLA